MLLWTEQSTLAWHVLESHGVLRADARRALFPDIFRNPYRWMTAQLRERVGPPPGRVTYPLWAWYQREGSRVPPRRWTTDSRPNVAIVFDIAPEDVLLSDFEEWHCVLNRGYVAETDEEEERVSDEFDARFETGVRPYDDPGTRVRIEESWPRIFDVWRGSPYRCDARCIQAVFWELRLEQVRRVIPLESRPRRRG